MRLQIVGEETAWAGNHSVIHGARQAKNRQGSRLKRFVRPEPARTTSAGRMVMMRRSRILSQTNMTLPLIKGEGRLGLKTMPCSLSGAASVTAGWSVSAEAEGATEARLVTEAVGVMLGAEPLAGSVATATALP